MTFKFGIVSTFNVLCGNATYSQALLDALSEHVDSVKIEIPLSVQKYHNKRIEKKIINSVLNCDAVNIQMELGIFGSSPRTSLKLLKKIIKNAKTVSLTMHRVEERPLSIVRMIFNVFKSGRINQKIRHILNLYVYLIYKKTYNVCG